MNDQERTPGSAEAREADCDRKDFEAQIGNLDRPTDAQSGAEFDKFERKTKADALREAAAALKAADMESPYIEVSNGMCADGWGNDSNEIDAGYASWLRRRAVQIDGGA